MREIGRKLVIEGDRESAFVREREIARRKDRARTTEREKLSGVQKNLEKNKSQRGDREPKQ